MSLTKPRALKAGSLLGIVSPASAAPADLVHRGIAELGRVGYRTRLFPHALKRGPLNYAGSIEERVADLHAAFADVEVEAIICTRGGWGTADLLPHIDVELVGANPKAFLGYSDLTSLHVWLEVAANQVSFQAPMVASDFAKPHGPDMRSWTQALSRTEPWDLGADAGLRVLRPGRAEGVLRGGCISIYAEALATPFAPRPQGGVLFLEDVGVKPYQWDRLLTHLKLAKMLDGVTGIVFGDMRECCSEKDEPLLEETLLYALRDFNGPVGIGLRSGHVAAANITLPFGVAVRLELEDEANPRMHFVESAVAG